MAEPKTIAGITVPEAETRFTKPVVDRLIERIKPEKDSISLADVHKVLNYGLESLLALQRYNEVWRDIKQKDASEDYKHWKERVSNIREKVASLDREYDELKRPHISKSSSLKENIKRALSEIIKLLEECPEETMPERVIKEVGVPSMEEYPTLQKAFQEVLSLIQSEGVKCIALEGQERIGKTTLMQYLNNHFYDNSFDEEFKFDVVIFIKVAADEQINDDKEGLHILQKIADRIGVDREGSGFDVAGRVLRVLGCLRYLLILHDIRHSSTLDKIELWLKISRINNGSKVVITAQNPLTPVHSVVEESVRLKPLSSNESRRMLLHYVGQNHLPQTTKPASPLEGESSSKSTSFFGELLQTFPSNEPRKMFRRTKPLQTFPSNEPRMMFRRTKPNLAQDVLRLMRIRDLIHAILSYPMSIGYEDLLKRWIRDVYRLHFAYDDADSLRRRVEHLLSERPLRYVQALISEDITEIINGGTNTPPKKVPQPILHLATRFALHQLTLCLTPFGRLEFDEIKNIWFSTRNDEEKRNVVAKIQANSRICEEFDGIEIVDLKHFIDEFEKEKGFLKPETGLEQTEDAESSTTNYGRRRLVVVVDEDGDKKADPLGLSFPIHDSNDVVVFITTQSSNDYLTNNVDLIIRTEDHLLPWELFCRIAGSELLHLFNANQRIAVQIVEKCGGHLLATILMAKSLQDETDVQIWKLALEKLLYRDREPIVNAFFFNIIRGSVTSERDKVHLIRCLMVFKLQDWDKNTSYYQLSRSLCTEQLVGTKKGKSILQNFVERFFLLQFEDNFDRRIIMPRDIKIILHALEGEIPEDLSEGALESTISDLQVLNLSNTHMRDLYDLSTRSDNQCLKLDGCTLETLPKAIFKLHKLETLSLEYCSQLLELPQQIAKLENLKDLRLTGCTRLKTLPQEIWELPNLETLNLSGTHTKQLPQSIKLPKLGSLLLGNNLNLMKIAPSFFKHVPQLSVLDLSRTSIHELPDPVFKLKELRELYLKECELFAELPPKIGQLINLTILDLDGTLITHLPQEVKQLKKLERLSLSFYNDSNHNSRNVIPYGVLTELTCLEVLRIKVNSDNEWWFENFELVLEQISALKTLQVLDVYIPGDEFKASIKDSLSNFRFIMGRHKPRMISRVPPALEVIFKENYRSLKFVNGEDFPDKVKSILSKSYAFYLDRHWKINNLAQFGLENLKQLQLYILAECNEMQSIMDVDEYGADSSDLKESFCMQFLTIFYMKNLRSILNKPIRDSTIFCELKLLALHTCPELETIFTTDSVNSLVNLEELIVEDCPNVSSVVSHSSSEPKTGSFLRRLRKLSLLFVPELASISNGVRIGRNMEQLGIYYCPKLQRLSTAELSSEKLKVIRGEMEWWENLDWIEWGQEDPPNEFNQIFSEFDEDLDILTQMTPYELMTSFNR